MAKKDENAEAKAAEDNKQNGIKRPEPGTATGTLWDIADDISKKLGRPAPRGAVIKTYMETWPNANKATAATQYARWVIYHNAADALKAGREAEKAERAKAREAERIEKQKAKDAEKAKKAKEAEEAKKAADAKAAAEAKAAKKTEGAKK